jgi:hypothetical protein
LSSAKKLESGAPVFLIVLLLFFRTKRPAEIKVEISTRRIIKRGIKKGVLFPLYIKKTKKKVLILRLFCVFQRILPQNLGGSPFLDSGRN